ncbi:MAG TPA: DUF2505 domain-containing protein [Kofleriaceae bacterium]
MSTEFSYETVFDASSKTAVLAAYFNDDHLATQDKVAELCDRVVVEAHEDDAIRKCVWSVRSQRPLPIFVRPFVDGGRLTYLESMTWRKADDEIDMTIVPQIAGGRVQIAAVYQLADVAPGKVRRRYRGAITVNVKLLSGKIERAIAAEIDKGMPAMTECTQSWLKRAGV